jgi:hypothetical protein
MFKNFGFYFPDSQFLSDPEGLLKYLGAKLQYGHVPLYESGDNPNAKQFQSLHAVQVGRQRAGKPSGPAGLGFAACAMVFALLLHSLAPSQHGRGMNTIRTRCRQSVASAQMLQTTLF